MPVIISCVNLKGGVGKTALAVNLAAFAGERRNLRTLLIDLDPQTNASFATIGVDAWHDHQQKHGTLADLLGLKRHTSAEDRQRTVAAVIARDVFPNVDLLPSHVDMFAVDLDLASATGRERRLKKVLSEHLENYDVVVCDCPPNLTIPTQNALTLSTHYVIPVSLDFLSSLGVALLIRRIDDFCEDVDHTLERLGIVISRVGRPARHRSETAAALREKFPDVLDSEIHERAAVSEAAEQHRSMFNFGNVDAEREFTSVCTALLNRAGLKEERE